MADLIWTEPALLDLDEVAEYIALDNPTAASNYVQKIFDRVERLTIYPNSGKRPKELPRTPYREIVIPPCRIFYRVEDDIAYILQVMRTERLLQPFLLDRRNKDK
ncbi:type II toxin-antitoxin system RelE/ParE family toxin [Pontiella agarivorans]|uniref:Type II toxin-antitoxin system RelE/ParE family toxin n=1 Tax=Pontiella agarivorans TaxID=3038953 RepID=A0ABU5MXB5_9BACT|nr:type II toxin-antitoxin system RelE/ParE family toxin [Pontiella agarivorans]MDZ8118815.1 type II toxin-antitoxin system RelE/ParE family toxin [Pontiella agarivorans]